MESYCNRTKDEFGNLIIPNLYDFAKNYMLIKDGLNYRKFNDIELNKLIEIQIMLDSGYELQYMHNRSGDFIGYKRIK